VAAVVAAALDRPGTGLVGYWRVHETFRRPGLVTELLNSLVDPNPVVRSSAARLCAALRLTEAVQWIGDMAGDPNPKVREAACDALFVSDGFSCRSQIGQGQTGRRGLHAAQVLALAREFGPAGPSGSYPEQAVPGPPHAGPGRKAARAVAATGLAAAAAGFTYARLR